MNMQCAAIAAMFTQSSGLKFSPKDENFYPDSVIMVRLTKPSNFKFPA